MSDASFVHLNGLNAADLNGDGKKEIIFGAREATGVSTFGCRGVVYAVQTNGSVLWKTFVRADVDSTPAVVPDLNGDGSPDIVVGMGAFEIPGETAWNECGRGNRNLPGNGGVVALNGRDGSILWVFDTADKGEWGVPGNGVLDGVWSSPASGDIRPDVPGPEIVFGAWDNCVYLLNKEGQSLWGVVPFPYDQYPTLIGQCNHRGFLSHDTVWSSPALADLDLDGVLEIIIGGDATHPNWYSLPNGGVLWVIGGDGSIKAQKWFDQAIYSSPAIGDLDGDGQREIVVGTGDFWYDPNLQHHTGNYVSVLNYVREQHDPKQRLRTKWTLPTNGPVRSSPALSDLNLDGYIDIVAISKYDNVGGQWTIGNRQNDGSYLYAWSGRDGQLLPDFPMHICDSTGQAFPINTSPLIADIVGDSRPEIIYPHGREIGIISWNSATNKFESYTRINENQPCWPATTTGGGQTSFVYGRLDTQSGAFTAIPVVDDLDGNGTVEIATVGRWNEDSGSILGDLWVWTNHKNGERPWPMFRQNPQHTGHYQRPPRLAVSPPSLFVLHPYGSGSEERAYLRLTNPGDFAAQWSVASSPAGVAVTPSSGTLHYTSTIPLTVTVSTAGYQTGTYSLGSLTITGTWSGGTVQNSPLSVPITLYVGPVYRAYLPLVMRTFR
ncbi:MAG: hypothetical protein NZ821_08380 [Gloeomargarita sp. SKYB31]|nr:hypothetical protein [Gloeomargarita sp. SKYB31]